MKWPDNDGTMCLSDITKPLREAVRFAFLLKPRNTGLDIPWAGPPVGREFENMTLSADKMLTREALRRAAEDGHDTMETLLALAVRLGHEHRRRMAIFDHDRGIRTDNEAWPRDFDYRYAVFFTVGGGESCGVKRQLVSIQDSREEAEACVENLQSAGTGEIVEFVGVDELAAILEKDHPSPRTVKSG